MCSLTLIRIRRSGICADRERFRAIPLPFFDSGRKISRYELAGVLQSALKEGKDLSSKDKEALQRLKKEYARELEARGYKEDKPRQDPVLEIHRDARIREIKGEGADARLRTQVTWHLSGNTSVQGQETVE